MRNWRLKLDHRQPSAVEALVGLRRARRRKPLGALTVGLLALTLLLAACASGSTTAKKTPTAQPEATANTQTAAGVDALILDQLKNMQADGTDSSAAVNGGLGGLWINWKYGTNPLAVNINGAGVPDNINPPRHDPLTDLRYLHNLLTYKSLHPSDTQFDGEISRYSKIVQADFVNTSTANDANPRGWVYDEFADMYALTHQSWYSQQMQALAAAWYAHNYHSAIGAIYFTTNTAYPGGYYRVDWAVEESCGLIQAGTLFNHPEWVAAGQSALAFVYSHAYLSAYHVFPTLMTDVVNSSGAANADEAFGTAGSQVSVADLGQESLSLLHAYMVTHDATYLNHAEDILDNQTATNDPLGMWDATHQGYYRFAVFSGNSYLSPGTPVVQNGPTDKKEVGRQQEMLIAFTVANALTSNRYQAMEQEMLHVAQFTYYAPGHGYLYEMTVAWQPVLIHHNGQSIPETWVTSEAMGILLEGLFATERAQPW